MKNANAAGLLGLLLCVSALSCQTERTPEATAETVRGVGADSPNVPTSGAKFSIQSLESNVAVGVYLNPEELSIDKSIPWAGGKGQAGGDKPALEFMGSEGRTMSFELFFDTYEDRGNVDKQYVQPFFELTKPVPELERPPRVLITWGTGLPPFEGVIESIGTKYTMFLPDGTPTRATVNLTVRESSSEPCSSDADCGAGERCRSGFCQWLGK